MGISQIILETITNQNVLSSISSTILIILLGFYYRKKGVFGDTVSKLLSSIVLKVAVPALAFTAFMKDIDAQTLQNSMGTLVWGILVYIILIFLTPLFYLKYEGDRKTTLTVLSIFGSTTFFGIPIINSVFGSEGTIYANVFNIGYRIFLYSYAYIMMSGLKFERKNLKQIFGNIIIIATFAGLLIWLFQGYLPQVAVTDPVTGEVSQYAFLRIDKTAYWLYRPLNYLAGLSSPLAWLSIGAQLGSLNIKEAMSSRISWYYVFVKLIMVPIINLVGILILNATGLLGIFPLSYIAIGSTMIMMATPTATVAAAYAISFDKDATLASNMSLLSTLGAVVMIPIWIVVLQVLSNLGII